MDRNELAGRLDGERYSIDADESGIRARVADAITGALMFGAQGVNAPPAGHWLTPFWEMARADAAANPTITASVSASDDYDLIDGFLRNNIDDADYADYSAALDRIYLAKPPAAALRESEWRPIESAPNPGIFLVLLERPMTGSFVHCANWSPNVKTIGTVFSFDAPKPTHWMPLPPPPAIDAARKEGV